MNPQRLEYEEGDPIPPRYALVTRPNRKLLTGGMITFMVPYVASVVVSTFALVNDDEEVSRGIATLLIPVAGPYVAIGALGANGAGAFWLSANGVVQTAGAILMAAAFAHEDLYLQRQESPSWVDVALRPEINVGPFGGSLRWKF
ncbi:hypothetical protein [Chondromyces apiculatus]|nr:hypothetical protein [Chondromyces apiculatus]